jgi:hypothetical protein
MGTAPQAASQPVFLAHARVFGDDLALPRQEYITYIPAALALTGILSWVMNDQLGLVMASVVATIVSVYTLWGLFFHHAPIRFSTLLAMALLLGYGAGALNTWITLPRDSLTLGEVMGLREGVLARGMAAVLFSSAALYFLGEIFEKPIFGRSFRFQVNGGTRMLIYVGTLAMIAGFLTHSLGIGGTASAQGHASIPGLFLSWLYVPLTAITVAAFLTAQRGRDRFLSGLAAFTLLLMFSVLGRRAAIYTSMEIMVMLGLVGYRWRGRGIRNILLTLAMGALIVVCALTFMLLRIAPESRSALGHETVAKKFQAAGKLVQQGHAYTMASTATEQNLQTRTFVLAFLANILDASSRATPALGRDALGLLESTIPTVLYPDKDRFFSEELLVDRQFGFGYGDEANSILTAGATDFGFLGMILYPLIIVAIARFLYDLIVRWLTINPLMVLTLSLILLFIQTEVILSSYLSEIRNGIIFGIVLALLMSFPRVRLRA